MTLFNGNPIIWSAYELGFKAKLPANPYKPETDEWYSYNRGWNANEH